MRYSSRRLLTRSILVLILLAALTGCSSRPEDPYIVRLEDGFLSIDPQAQTITCDSQTYTYTVSENGSWVTYRITYPNGASYYWEQNGSSGSGGGSGDYRDDIYVSGDVLVDAIASYKAPKTFGSNFFIGLLVVALGVFPAVWPQTAWYLDFGWRFKDAEPSQAALVLHRVGGVVLIVVGIVLMFV